MELLRVVVEGLPPKKDGANSMWRKPSEIPRLLALRHAVQDALGGREPFSEEVALDLVVHVAGENSRTIGDLDNFITGICDGLQAAAQGTPWHGHLDWSDASHASVTPDRTIGIRDDADVLSIRARKALDGADAHWYELGISGR